MTYVRLIVQVHGTTATPDDVAAHVRSVLFLHDLRADEVEVEVDEHTGPCAHPEEHE